jgi:pimeloyl-ACP methyl ester carboxylesterase
MAMAEQEIKIPILGTNLKIHGVLRGEFTSPLAILTPGLGGWMHDLILFNAARYFEENDISTLRIDFYGYDEDQRDIKDFDVKVGAEDLDAVVDYAIAKGANWIVVVGHSYSGMTIVYSNKQKFNAAILWDPSHTGGYDEPMAINNLEEDFIYIKEFDAYVSGNAGGDVISRKVFENYQPGSTTMAKKFKIPTLVINADSSREMKAYGKDYADNISAATKHVIIPNSTHPFTEDGALEKLYEESVSWIKEIKQG